jgi:hypothetical protein
VRLVWIPRGQAIAICGRSSRCTAEVSWQRASVPNVRAYRPACSRSRLQPRWRVALSRGEMRLPVAAIDLTPNCVARGVVARAFVVASTRFSLEPLTRPHELRRVKMVGLISSSGTHQSSFDRNRIAEEVENGAMGVNRRGQFLISSSVLWPT